MFDNPFDKIRKEINNKLLSIIENPNKNQIKVAENIVNEMFEDLLNWQLEIIKTNLEKAATLDTIQDYSQVIQDIKLLRKKNEDLTNYINHNIPELINEDVAKINLQIETLKLDLQKINKATEANKQNIHHLNAIVSRKQTENDGGLHNVVEDKIQPQNLIVEFQNVISFINNVAEEITDCYIAETKEIDKRELISNNIKSIISKNIFEIESSIEQALIVKKIENQLKEYDNLIVINDFNNLDELSIQGISFYEKIQNSKPKVKIEHVATLTQFDTAQHELSDYDCEKSGEITISVYPSFSFDGEIGTRIKPVVYTKTRNQNG